MRRCNFWAIGLLAMGFAGAAEPPKTEQAQQEISQEEAYTIGKELFERLAPVEIKTAYEFPDKAQWDEFAARLQTALESNDLAGLAQYEPEVRAGVPPSRLAPPRS